MQELNYTEMRCEWETLLSDEQKKLLNVHGYFCGLHYLVAFADTSEENHGSDSNGESGPLRLIRTICKLVQESGCEKSGKMVTFATFLKETHQVINLPLYPLLGNQFNQFLGNRFNPFLNNQFNIVFL